jgi:hypothetical protein
MMMVVMMVWKTEAFCLCLLDECEESATRHCACLSVVVERCVNVVSLSLVEMVDHFKNSKLPP